MNRATVSSNGMLGLKNSHANVIGIHMLSTKIRGFQRATSWCVLL